MPDKQNFNGNRGESRSHAILSEMFYVSKRSVDVDGTDLIVEIPFEDIREFRRFKQQGVVQAKYFEDQNEVKIAKEYVHDEDGTRTNFFALIHSNNQDGENVHYFFTAEQIIEKFRIRNTKASSKQYYVFSLTKARKFKRHQNLPINTINNTIEEGILKTEEYSRQKLIKEVEDKFKQPIRKTFENSNAKHFKSLEGKHIIDKLYISLNIYKEFRRMTSWRLINKIAFQEKHNTSTYYKQFSIHTNHTEIIEFFRNISISEKVTFKNRSFHKGVKNAEQKLTTIIDILNQNLIVKIIDISEGNEIKIQKTEQTVCNCRLCKFYNLDFIGAIRSLKSNANVSIESWDSLREAYTLMKIGHYDIAKEMLENLEKKSKEHKKSIFYFVVKYNQRSLAWKTWEENYPDMQYELNNLNTSSYNYEILNTLVTDTLTRDYSDSVDEIYLKIKEFKKRKSVNDTADLINKLYSKFAEYINFIEGNFLDVSRSNELKTLTEKTIECFIISYSMNNSFSNHLNSLNDFIIRIIMHNCDPSKLISYFQRNKVHKIPYETESNYFYQSIDNFFSKSNIAFLKREIVYYDNQTKNVTLRRKTENIFENICILLAYLENNTSGKGILKKINFFINELDFSVHNISFLAHPLLRNPEKFETKDIVQLIEILLQKKLLKGYLLTNCLLTLVDKKFVFDDSHSALIDEISRATIKHPSYGVIKAIPLLFSKLQFKKFKEIIQITLEENFENELYYQAIVNDCIEKSLEQFRIYSEPFLSIRSEKTHSLFLNQSPFTGIPFRFSDRLNKFVDVIYAFDYSVDSDNDAIKEVRQFHPYYDFIISVKDGVIPINFNFIWLLENQSLVVLTKLSPIQHLADKLKSNLKENYHDELAKLYLKHFSK